MPTRRILEMTVVTVILLHPVIAMVKTWAAKHVATSSNEATTDAATVAHAVL